MSGNTIGKIFRVTNWGESHGKAIGVVIDGCPSMLSLDEKDIQADLERRRPGQSSLTTLRDESDKIEILSGVFDGKTTGSPISLMIKNKDAKSNDYDKLKDVFRPGHADLTIQQKFGIRDYKGGGRSSARITAGNVAAGAIAKKLLKELAGIEIIAFVKQVKDVVITAIIQGKIKASEIDKSLVRCPDKKASEQMIKIIEKAKAEGDSVGGVIECIVRNVPAGLGEPVFDKLSADLAKAMMSINAAKGFEIGFGFACAEMFGSEHNDGIIVENNNNNNNNNNCAKIKTRTNNAGGILGGISNGMPIIMRIAFKPASTIKKKQNTVDINGNAVELEAKGRHDPCVLPRAVPVVEAMAAIVLCDHFLRQKALSVFLNNYNGSGIDYIKKGFKENGIKHNRINDDNEGDNYGN
ncbi:MAG: chorismate synthase [Candidatus Woesearchaeota archaeon]